VSVPAAGLPRRQQSWIVYLPCMKSNFNERAVYRMNYNQIQKLKLISFDVFDGLDMCMGEAPPTAQFAYLLPFADMWFKHRSHWSKGHFTVVGYGASQTFLAMVGGSSSITPPAAQSPPLDGTLIALSEDELEKQIALPAAVFRASRKVSSAAALRKELRSVFADAKLLYTSEGTLAPQAQDEQPAPKAPRANGQDTPHTKVKDTKEEAKRRAAAAVKRAAERSAARKGPTPQITVHRRGSDLRLVKEVPVPMTVGLTGQYVWQLLQVPGIAVSVAQAAADDKRAQTLLPPSSQPSIASAYSAMTSPPLVSSSVSSAAAAGAAASSAGGGLVSSVPNDLEEQSTDADSPETITDFEQLDSASAPSPAIGFSTLALRGASADSSRASIQARRAEHLVGFDRPVRHDIDRSYKLGGSSSPKVSFALE